MTEGSAYLAQTKRLLQGSGTLNLCHYVKRYHKRVGPSAPPHYGFTREDLDELQRYAQDLLRERLPTHEYLELLASLPIQPPPTDHDGV